jgi:lysyl-tRNA synthetase class 2
MNEPQDISPQSDALKEDVVRLQHLETIKKEGINPFPAQSVRTHTLQEASNLPDETNVKIVGRIITRREMGKLTFCHLQDASGKLQIAGTPTTLRNH